MRFSFRPLTSPSVRRFCQVVCLLIFFFLFIQTDYSGTDTLPYAVNIIFRLDPLIAVSAMLATRTLITLVFPALIMVILTLVLGRFFCGWICPMGTLLDYSHHFFRPAGSSSVNRFRNINYFLLIFILTSAFFGLPVVGYFDPFSILVRGLTLAVYPGLNAAATALFTATYQHAPQFVNTISEPLYGFLKQTILPFNQHVFTLVYLSFGMLLAVFLMELLGRRFFCRFICPLGAFFGLIARFSFFRGHGGSDTCGKCRICQSVCRMEAVREDRSIAMHECILCLDCVPKCPRRIISFNPKKSRTPPVPVSISRRNFIWAGITGTILPMALPVRSLTRVPDPWLIRPPGALPEAEFLARCVRCGECMKVCIGNALHPTFLEAGLDGMLTPKLIARIGYCEYQCTLCGQVCPTGAIQRLAPMTKQKQVIGMAHFDKNRCLPYAAGIPCIVCEEHCPTPDKAIKFRLAVVLTDQGTELTVKQPYIVEQLCIGCGICETKCPIPGVSAVRVTSAGESRNPDHALPDDTWMY